MAQKKKMYKQLILFDEICKKIEVVSQFQISF